MKRWKKQKKVRNLVCLSPMVMLLPAGSERTRETSHTLLLPLK